MTTVCSLSVWVEGVEHPAVRRNSLRRYGPCRRDVLPAAVESHSVGRYRRFARKPADYLQRRKLPARWDHQVDRLLRNTEVCHFRWIQLRCLPRLECGWQGRLSICLIIGVSVGRAEWRSTLVDAEEFIRHCWFLIAYFYKVKRIVSHENPFGPVGSEKPI